jgi:HEAT repeat protein
VSPRASVDEQLAALDTLLEDRVAHAARVSGALRERHYRVVAKAARLAEDGLFYELAPELLQAYARFLVKPAKTDPNCIAKQAIARALVALDCDDALFFVRGLQYRQPEPTWGGSADTAVDLRCSCAMGLVATGFPRALVELTALLNDSEAGARAGAVRAIACGQPREAELLLRTKALAGDAEPGVIGECFTGLLAVEPDESVAFVARFLRDTEPTVRELAALALGESRLDRALAPLQEAWNEVLIADEFRRTLLRAASAHRSEAALDWVLSIVAEARVGVAIEVIEALALYKRNEKLARRLEGELTQRGERALLERFAALWNDAPRSE